MKNSRLAQTPFHLWHRFVVYVLLFFATILILVPSCATLSQHDASLENVSLKNFADPDSVPAAVMATIRQELDQQAKAGMSGVFRLQWGDDVFLEAYGWQDREAERPMTDEVGFDVGSITKVMTAATVFQLAEAGQLQTTDPVGQFFPEAPPQIRDITIDQLLTHTSGLPEYLGDDYDRVDRETVLNRIFASRLRFPTGTQEVYSNTGYTLLALIIEAASGLPYEQAVREAVFIPAGTLRIGYRLADWTNEDLAVGYRGQRRWGTPLDQTWLEDGPSWTLRGNGGMLATVDELARWFDAVFAGRVLGPEAFARFTELYAGTDEHGLRIGEAGGNDVFNALHEGWVDLGVNLTFFTSVSSHSAEDVFDKISDEIDRLVQAIAQTGA